MVGWSDFRVWNGKHRSGTSKNLNQKRDRILNGEGRKDGQKTSRQETFETERDDSPARFLLWQLLNFFIIFYF